MAGSSCHPDVGIAGNAPPASIALAPLGVPLRVELDRPDQAAALWAACASWDREADPAARPLRIKLRMDMRLEGTGEVRIEATTAKLRLTGPGVDGWSDAQQGDAACKLSHAWLASPELLRDSVLEPLALFLLTRRDRTPIHAAGMIVEDLAILLAGASGSGKSCTAAAAGGAGLDVLSDDTVYLQQRPALRLRSWGGPPHLFAQDITGPRGAARIRNGKTKYAVPLGSHGRSEWAGKTAIALIERGERAKLTPLDSDEARRRLTRLEPGFDLRAAEIEIAHRLLIKNGAWLLTLSKDPADAIAVLLCNLERLRTTAVC